tara:strand:+ start:52 stop:645 length:594 start_codon:yes stop_codon:yes gene_type:complete
MDNINNNIIWSKGPNGLKLITKNDSTADEWDPYESELAAAMFNGIEIFPIQKNSKILCLDKNFELTLNHILNIIGNDGRINLISENISKNIEKNFINNPNIEISNISSDILPNDFDIFYINVPDQDSFNIMKKLKTKLKQNGYFLLVLNTSDINDEISSTQESNSTFQKIKSLFEIIQVVFLDSYFTNHTMIIGRQA